MEKIKIILYIEFLSFILSAKAESAKRPPALKIAEQVANIFALLVLIPEDIRIRDLKAQGIDELVEKYVVTEDAIYSRMLLSSVNKPATENV